LWLSRGNDQHAAHKSNTVIRKETCKLASRCRLSPDPIDLRYLTSR
jgi:hypothetical protein